MPTRRGLRLFEWGHGVEAVGLVLDGDFSVTQAYRGETFGETHARAVPPIAADGAAGLEDAIFVMDGFVYMQVPLQDGNNVVIFEEGDDVGRIFDAVGIVFLAAFGLGRIAEEAGDERDVADDDDRRGGWGLFLIGGEPLELGVVDAAFPLAVVGGKNGIENDEVVALAVEGRVGAGADAIFKHFFGVLRVGGCNAAFGQAAADVVIDDGVVERDVELRFRFLVEIEEQVGAGAIDGKGVENQIAAVNGEFGFECGDFLEGHGAAVGGVEFGLDVRVGEENKIERAGGGVLFDFGGGGAQQRGARI